MSFHYNRSSSSQPISITPTYSFEELQDIWNLQKEILNKYKSSQVPFVILDQDNSGVISSKDFPYRLVARGFPCNTALYLKFFAFLDTNNDGFINMEDWIEGFKSIGARFVETRCKAREELKAANLIAHSRTSSSIDGYNTTPAKYTQNSFEASSQKSWATPKNIESSAILQTPIQLTQYSSEDPMQRINFGFNSQLNNGQGIGRRLSTEPHSIMHNKQEQTLQIDTSGDTHKDAAMRINARVDNILKNIESRKNLFSGATPKMDFMSDIKRTESLVSPTAQFQKMSAGLKSEAQKPEEIHHSIKKSAADTIGAIRSKLGLDPVGKDSAVKIIEEKGAYTPSVTSITGTEEDVPTPKIAENIGFGTKIEAKENNLQIKSLKSLLPQRKPSPQESKRSLASQSSASRGEEGNSYLDQVTRAIAAKRKNNSQQSIAIPTHSASEKDLETPSWKDSPAFRTGDLEEGAVLEMMEKLLEKYGSHDEALKSLRKEDLLRFPRLRMFVNSLEGQTWFKDKVNRGRQFCNGVRKRSRTKSMIELRVKGDLVKEIEMEVQRRRAITPDISMSHIVYKDTVKADKRPDRIANAEKMIESLKEFAKQSVRAKGKTKSQKVGAELAKEILEGKEARNGLSVYNRVQEKLRGERKYGEAQRTCQEVREMFGSRKKEVKTEIKKSNNEEVLLNNFGYSIQLDEFRKNSSSSLLRRESLLNRKENIRGIVEDDKRLKLRGVIDQLSHEAASMEASFSRSRTDLRKPLLQENIDNKQRLLNMMTQKNEVKVEKLLVPEKRRVKSFIRGSISSTHLGSDDFCSTQSSIETQLRDRLSQNRPVNRYSKLANDLGALSVTIDKPERKVSISPIHRTRTSKNSSISVSSLLKEEYLGRGKSFLQSDYTGMSSLLKEFSTPATTKSSKRIGFNKY